MHKRAKHPHKAIEEAIKFAEANKWRYQKSGRSAHAWCRLLCSLKSREGCMLSVWSTPKSPEAHAQQIQKRVIQCPHS